MAGDSREKANSLLPNRADSEAEGSSVGPTTEDWQSVDLLASSPELDTSPTDSRRSRNDWIPSPATQTLNHLSQNTFDLRLSDADTAVSTMPSPPNRSGHQKSPPNFMLETKSRQKKKPIPSQSPLKRSPEHYTRKSIPILHVTSEDDVLAEFTSIRHAASQTGEKRGDVVIALQKGTLLNGHYFRYKDPTLSSCQKPKKPSSNSSTASFPQPSLPRSSRRRTPHSKKIRSLSATRSLKKSSRSGTPTELEKLRNASPSPIITAKRHNRSHSLGSAASLLVDFKRSKSPETLDSDLPFFSRGSPSTSPLLGKQLDIPEALGSLEQRFIPFRFVHIDIPPKRAGGDLGITVSRSTPPSRLSEWTTGCRVKSVDDDSWAVKHGLYESDWIWDPKSQGLLEYEKFLDMAREWANQDEQNLRLTVLRWDENAEVDPIESQWTLPSQRSSSAAFSPLLAQSPVAAAAGAAAAKLSALPSFKANVASTNPVLVRPKALTASSGTSSKKRKELELVDDNVPFCRKCNGRKARVHHVWCPKSAQFKKSGGERILQRIKDGLKLDCPVCLIEFQQGKLKRDRDHNEDCLAHQLVLHEKHEPKGKSLKCNETKSSNQGKETIDGQRKPWENELLSTDGDDDSALSEYRDPILKRKTILLPTNSSRSKKNCTRDTIGFRKGSINQTRSLQNQSVASKQQAPQNSNRSRARTHTITPTTQKGEPSGGEEEECEWKEDEAIVEFDWESCPDPWGKPGYQEGDEVLFSSHQLGFGGHHDVALPTNRFESDLFSKGSKYTATHHSPQEGSQWLILRRDPLGKMDWGFTWYRHEFGGACLVGTVAHSSPASAARFVGGSNSQSGASLRPKDMVLAINNKIVAGLTEAALQVELDMPSSEISLLVSRFKHSEEVRARLVDQDNSSWKILDASINDSRILDWIDAGVGAAQHTPVALNPNHGSPQNDKLKPQRDQNHCFMSTNPLGQQGFQRYKGPIQDQDETGFFHIDTKPRKNEPPPGLQIQLSTKTAGMTGADVAPKVTTTKLERQNQRSPLQTSPRRVQPSGQNGLTANGWLEDQNAWAGCVCGETHGESIPVFWVQCDKCDTWYNVSSTCVGLTEQEVETQSLWKCWGCESEAGGSPSKSLGGFSANESPFKSPGGAQRLEGAEFTVKHDEGTNVEGKTVQTTISRVENEAHCQSANALADKNLHPRTITETKCSIVLENEADEEKLEKAKAKAKRNREIQEDRFLPDGHIRPKSQPVKDSQGFFKRACGRGYQGYSWNKERGLWSPPKADKQQAPHLQSAQKQAPRPQGVAADNNEQPQVKPTAHTISSMASATIETRNSTATSQRGLLHPPSPQAPSTFTVGDYVMVKQHAWSGVNNEAGIAQILHINVDNEGNTISYNVKYVVGKKRAAILPVYLQVYTF